MTTATADVREAYEPLVRTHFEFLAENFDLLVRRAVVGDPYVAPLFAHRLLDDAAQAEMSQLFLRDEFVTGLLDRLPLLHRWVEHELNFRDTEPAGLGRAVEDGSRLGFRCADILLRNCETYERLWTELAGLLITGYATAAVFEWLMGAQGVEPPRQPYRGSAEWEFWTTHLVPRFSSDTQEVDENGLVPLIWQAAVAICAEVSLDHFLDAGVEAGCWSIDHSSYWPARTAVIAGATLYWSGLMEDISPL
jgi:hypothetical protein